MLSYTEELAHPHIKVRDWWRTRFVPHSSGLSTRLRVRKQLKTFPSAPLACSLIYSRKAQPAQLWRGVRGWVYTRGDKDPCLSRCVCLPGRALRLWSPSHSLLRAQTARWRGGESCFSHRYIRWNLGPVFLCCSLIKS